MTLYQRSKYSREWQSSNNYRPTALSLPAYLIEIDHDVALWSFTAHDILQHQGEEQPSGLGHVQVVGLILMPVLNCCHHLVIICADDLQVLNIWKFRSSVDAGCLGTCSIPVSNPAWHTDVIQSGLTAIENVSPSQGNFIIWEICFWHALPHTRRWCCKSKSVYQLIQSALWDVDHGKTGFYNIKPNCILLQCNCIE